MIEISVKQNPIGKIPKGWEIVKLEEFIDIYDKERIPLSEMERANRKGVYPYCGANGVLDYIDDYIFEGEFILLAEDGGSYGKFEDSCYMMNGKFWVNNHAHIIKVKKNKSTNHFLLYMLNFLDLRSYVVGSTRVKLNQEYLKQIKVSYPPLPEQQKIAGILGTVDEAIAKVDKAIEKTERLKKGLMRELLTKGIGHKEFKDSEIGRIPKDWEVVKLGNDNLFKITMGSSPPSSTYNAKKIGVPFLQGNAEFGAIFPSPIKYCSSPQKIANKGNILISVRAPVGDINLADQECCIGRGVASIQTKKDFFNSGFLFYFLKFNRSCFEKASLGSTFKAIRREEVDNFRLSKPNISEQQKIAAILSTVDKKIDMEKKRKEKFERIKKGLMNDLLTGRKRVRI